MALTKCPKKHVYDSSIYPSCPVCNPSNAINFVEYGDSKPEESQKIYNERKYKLETLFTTAPDNIDPVPADSRGITMSPDTSALNTGAMEKATLTQGPIGPALYEKERIPVAEGGITLPPENIKNKNIKNHDLDKTKQYTVGWLVCVGGSFKGKSFELYKRDNTIGYDNEDDIYLKERKSNRNTDDGYVVICSENYEFTFARKCDKDMPEINGVPIAGRLVLKPYDMITVSEYKFIFIPFCGNCFTWEN